MSIENMNMDNNYKMMKINKTSNDVQQKGKISIYENHKMTITTSIKSLDTNNEKIYICNALYAKLLQQQ